MKDVSEGRENFPVVGRYGGLLDATFNMGGGSGVDVNGVIDGCLVRNIPTESNGVLLREARFRRRRQRKYESTRASKRNPPTAPPIMAARGTL